MCDGNIGLYCEGKPIYKFTLAGLLPVSEAVFVYGKWATGILKCFESPIATKASSSEEPLPIKKERDTRA